MVEDELKIDVSELMRAASITASIRPLRPVGIFSFTSMMKARLVHPDLSTIIRINHGVELLYHQSCKSLEQSP